MPAGVDLPGQDVGQRAALALPVVGAPQQRRGRAGKGTGVDQAHRLHVDDGLRVGGFDLADQRGLAAGKGDVGPVVVFLPGGGVGAHHHQHGVIPARRRDGIRVDCGAAAGAVGTGAREALHVVDLSVRIDGLHGCLDAVVAVDVVRRTGRGLDAGVAAEKEVGRVGVLPEHEHLVRTCTRDLQR